KLKTQNWLAELFPPLFGKQLTEHVLVNNWANGWVLPSEETQNSKLKIQNETTEQTVKIIFWPQYLEYIGFGLLILSFLYLLRYHRK
ncbi:hypothetical protein HY468_04520, partial [Candidatus Roizmanbacteria bacterium]|nr:hypothetical protein [Candidatus Roizmanbacteria bacterium]